jgi:hypothetical protein
MGAAAFVGDRGERKVTEAVFSICAILAILQVKHFICDYTLQNSYQLLNKGAYLHPGGLLHAGLHALFTMVAFLVVVPTWTLGLGIVVGEFLVHYHIDWTKEQVIRRTRWAPMQARFWWAIGFDQLLHQLTYIVIAALLVGTLEPL